MIDQQGKSWMRSKPQWDNTIMNCYNARIWGECIWEITDLDEADAATNKLLTHPAVDTHAKSMFAIFNRGKLYYLLNMWLNNSSNMLLLLLYCGCHEFSDGIVQTIVKTNMRPWGFSKATMRKRICRNYDRTSKGMLASNNRIQVFTTSNRKDNGCDAHSTAFAHKSRCQKQCVHSWLHAKVHSGLENLCLSQPPRCVTWEVACLRVLWPTFCSLSDAPWKRVYSKLPARSRSRHFEGSG